MNAREFLVLADELVNKPQNGPAINRTVIGRSYYAAFNVATAPLVELRIPLDKTNVSHKEVLDIVAQSKDRTLKQACESLARQRAVRNRATTIWMTRRSRPG